MTLASAALLTLCLTATAPAAINRTFSLDSSHRTAAWTGAPAATTSGFFWYTDTDPAGSCGVFTSLTLKSQTVPGQSTPTPLPPGWTPPVTTPPVTTPHDWMDYCDTTLVYLAQGRLDATLPDPGDGMTSDWDLYVYSSDKAGAWGGLVGESVTGGVETVTVPVATGWYLINAVPFYAANAGYSGSLTFTPTQDVSS